MAHSPDASTLQALRGYRTPLLYDAIERFAVRGKTEGYTDGSIRCVFPQLGSFVGHAVTAKIIGEFPLAEGEAHLTYRDVWEHVAAQPAGSIMVVQDLDTPTGRACAWGDVAATVFQRLGCVGVLTNGSVRDLPDILPLGFGLFAGSVSVGHGNIRFVTVGTPVRVGGLLVNPGDLLHMDEHGAMIIPPEVPLDELRRVADEIIAAEAGVKRYCARADFDFTQLDHMHAASMGERVDGA
ncbi:RraA family protein [Pseudomonas mangiferae]|uniref:Putative 4-hydroxy-4-methyl-2-oxoglutarate aldolase n=1 Tax=Pseudomonas mangiferae TaxID=2593654 RepID=A0A553GXG4_9PSED|nr:RraA family protein [Pseudomonas mangiferae]TRX74176.1 RraA family protein [Pseudomonas mangiferae]